jgi:hypothetical protein
MPCANDGREIAMVTTADQHDGRAETYDVFSRGRVLTIVAMFVLMLAASSLREDLVTSLESRVALLRRAPVDTGWISVKGVLRTATYADSVEQTGPHSYLFVVRYRLAASYAVIAREEVDCERRVTRTVFSRRSGILNDTVRAINLNWYRGDAVTQRKLSFLCGLRSRGDG